MLNVLIFKWCKSKEYFPYLRSWKLFLTGPGFLFKISSQISYSINTHTILLLEKSSTRRCLTFLPAIILAASSIGALFFTVSGGEDIKDPAVIPQGGLHWE
jgi:hypothetical protein